jgi:hypothetical protein
VPFNVTKPRTVSYCASMPSSFAVGTSGSTFMRLADRTMIGRTSPALICDSASAKLSIPTSRLPLTTFTTMSPPPRKGTAVGDCSPALRANPTSVMWSMLPMWVTPTLNLRVLPTATSSCAFLMGLDLPTMRICGSAVARASATISSYFTADLPCRIVSRCDCVTSRIVWPSRGRCAA